MSAAVKHFLQCLIDSPYLFENYNSHHASMEARKKTQQYFQVTPHVNSRKLNYGFIQGTISRLHLPHSPTRSNQNKNLKVFNIWYTGWRGMNEKCMPLPRYQMQRPYRFTKAWLTKWSTNTASFTDITIFPSRVLISGKTPNTAGFIVWIPAEIMFTQSCVGVLLLCAVMVVWLLIGPLLAVLTAWCSGYVASVIEAKRIEVAFWWFPIDKDRTGTN